MRGCLAGSYRRHRVHALQCRAEIPNEQRPHGALPRDQRAPRRGRTELQDLTGGRPRLNSQQMKIILDSLKKMSCKY